MISEISIMDVVDVALVAAMLYYFYKLMKQSGSLNVFIGILLFFFSWIVVSKLLQMRLLGSIMDQLMSVGAVALIVIFQDEVRNFFKRLGSHKKVRAFLSRFFQQRSIEKENEMVMPVVMACVSMAQQKVGALIVVEKEVSLDEIASTGETINANVGQRLLEAIFFKNAPLHDGAIIIRGNRILAAQCILPVSHDLNIPKQLGLRHRSAMGIAEKTDAIAIIVSEETGSISVASKGKFKLGLNAQQLESILSR
jgi:uncharacterized protein (TIGR00159 family)